MTSFADRDTWIFDLDNTLYPASCRLFDQMHVKMGQYVMRRFGVAFDEAFTIQKMLYHKHGTTLRGLMVEHGEEPEEFLDQVHDIDYSSVPPSPELLVALRNLKGRKLVFTNGTTRHAKAVLKRLGVAEAFEGIYDIVDSDYIPKPDRSPYVKFLNRYNVEPKSSAFFEDLSRNLEVPHHMGMTTVLVSSLEHPDADHLGSSGNEPHVHHRTTDLPAFLSQLKA